MNREFLERISKLSPKRLALLAVELQSKLEKAQQPEPIAVIGMSCRFPGSANSPEAFWELLDNGIDAITEIPTSRYNVDDFYDPDPSAPGKMATRWGGFVDNFDQFEPQFFGITPREATTMDPQQRMLLEVSWEAIERAGYAPNSFDGSPTGVFIGICNVDYYQMISQELDKFDIYTTTGSAHSVAPGRLSYLLGLKGPSIAVDTACSSSLVSLHLAVQSLRNQECEMALAGGVNVLISPKTTVSFSQASMMAPDGRCKAFSDSANGFVRSEGCGMVVLKRLSNAIADGDQILAVIRGIATNQDGRSNGLTAPNGPSQESVIRAALANGSVTPDQVSFIETHGTGTSLGDPIEVQALNEVYGPGRSPEQPLLLGSVKTNIGHLESAAGIAGFIKLVLILNKKKLPPHLHMDTPNKFIPWDELPIAVPTDGVDLVVEDGRLIGGVSSFGFSGTNVHIIAEEPPAPKAKPTETGRTQQLLTFSARSKPALERLTGQFTAFFADNPSLSLADAAYTANNGRAHFSHRFAITVDSLEAAQSALADFTKGQTNSRAVTYNELASTRQPPVAFLFTGQGAQYAGMGQDLFNTESVFRETVEACDEILQPLLDKPLLSILFPETEADASLIDQTQYTQPALFVLEYALAKLWESWGIVPTAVMGHSVGEYVAACIAGVFSLEDGLRLIAARGRLMGNLPAGGSMAAVFADETQVQSAIANYTDQVSIAAVNGPTNIVISGEGTAVSEILEQLASKGVKAKPLTVSHAFHSPLMDPILAEFADVAAGVTFAEPQIDLISNVSGDIAGREVMTAAYWRDHIRQAVRFANSMISLEKQGYAIFLECGPKPTLLGMAQYCLPDNHEATWIPSLRSQTQDSTQILISLGTLFTNGITVNWQAFHANSGRRITLPTYPFQRKRYWVDPPKSKKRAHKDDIHPLLHEKLESPLLQETVFSSQLALDDPAYLNDHRIFNIPLFPGTGFLEVAWTAATKTFTSQPFEIVNLQIQDTLTLPENGGKSIQVAVSPWQEGQATIRIFSQSSQDDWKLYATADVIPSTSSISEIESVTVIKERCEEEVTANSYYQQLANIGLNYGPAFQRIQQINRCEGEALGLVQLSNETAANGYYLHPALLEACFQLIGTTFTASDDDAHVYVTVSVSRFKLLQSAKTAVYCHVQLNADSEQANIKQATIHLYDDNDQLVALIEGIRLQRISRFVLQQAIERPFADFLYKVAWQPTPLQKSTKTTLSGEWLILADKHGIGDSLAEKIHGDGATCIVVRADKFDLLSPQAYDTLLANHTFQGIVHLWAQDNDNLDSENLEQAQKLVYGSALNLAQALLRHNNEKTNVWFFTQEAQNISQDLYSPGQTSLWGLAGSLAAEIPQFQPVICDLGKRQSIEESANTILQELKTGDDEDQVAWRNNTRYASRLIRFHPEFSTSDDKDNSNPTRLKENNTYLITGGMGGIGIVLAQGFVTQGARYLVLMGRHSPSTETLSVIKELEAAGAQIIIAQGDVSKSSDIKRVLAQIESEMPPLAGIVHAAGILSSGILPQQSWEKYHDVMQAKVVGAWNLHNQTQSLSLDFLVFFSAGVALLGSVGQVNFSAANAFMDGLAQFRKLQGLPALSINWGTWENVDSTADKDTKTRNQWQSSGIGLISPEEGIEIFFQLLSQAESQIGVFPIDWRRLAHQNEIIRKRPLFSQLLPQSSETSLAYKVEGSDTLLTDLEQAPADEQLEILQAYVQNQVIWVLGLDPTQTLDITKGLTNIGMDSLMAVEISKRLQAGVKQSLPTTIAFEHPTIEALTSYLATDIISLQVAETEEKPEETDKAQEKILAEIEHLSETEAADSLLKELEEAGY